MIKITYLFFITSMYLNSGFAKSFHPEPNSCSAFFVKFRYYRLKSQLSPELAKWVRKTPTKQSEDPVEVFFKKVFWIQDNFKLLEINPRTGRGTGQWAYPNERQAVELAYAAIARDFDVEFLSQRLVTYRYQRKPVNNMEDFMKYFFADETVGYGPKKRAIPSNEIKSLFK
jgi:hypothetical protein